MNDTTLPIQRKKVALKKGFAIYDWKRLLNSATDLAQRRGQPFRPISLKEIAQHNKVHDGWIALHSKVYNIGPYLHYHPGGIDIMKDCLGTDCSELFDKYHRWVNIENLVGKLQIGWLQEDDISQDSFSMPPPRPRPGVKVGNLLPDESNDLDDDLNPWEK
jgi:cytochrome-b5 reductase